MILWCFTFQEQCCCKKYWKQCEIKMDKPENYCNFVDFANSIAIGNIEIIGSIKNLGDPTTH